MLNNLRKVFSVHCFKQQSRFLASLTNNDSRNNIYYILNPYIDFAERLNNKKLHESLAQRNIEIDIENLIDLWKQYKHVEETKLKLERLRWEIAEKIKKNSDPTVNKQEIDELKVKGKIIREDLKNLLNVFSDLEQVLLPKITRLPNNIENEIYPKDIEFFFIPNFTSDYHLHIGEKLDLVKYISPSAYFLKDEAAEFELVVTSSFFNFFTKHGFIPFSNPDFSRSPIIEGCSVNPDSLLKLQHDSCDVLGDQFYVNGNTSLMPFCSFHSKNICEKIPVQYVSQGRQYIASNLDHSDGLYSVCQNNSVQIFIGSSQAMVSEKFNSAVALILEMYKQFDLHFRVVKIHPSQLELSEALKVSFQVHSPFKNEYIEVGNLSFYGEYISKKLRMYYKDNEDNKFMSIISGTVLKIPPLLAAYLENKNNCKIPENIVAYT